MNRTGRKDRLPCAFHSQAAAPRTAAIARAFPAFPRFGARARRRVHGNYLIVYDVEPDVVTIIAVVHGARDIDELDRPH
ncbi:type II toxin-antitoxin system RelE/ParE family toxin [Hephaestia mangrovi]|uniref:type II toxin-antitoxin system RelE/ParE family toxin n=1 Tax=Hephaestia mangrovi TaxID=2873268 RepID=UPI001CA6607A|nr:type II toxin-antitoxin system RelE/ParE family toxin [Hephaestia mangrovi]MBY8828691.1 type II toxin-antitoxin system RelE/ParE family toxin [Hephaestia mangrovi]